MKFTEIRKKFINGTVLWSGGKNIAADMEQQWAQVDPEPVDLQSFRDDIMNRTEFEKIKAIKNGRVYTVYGRFSSTPRRFLSVAYSAKWLHPDLFTDLAPQAIHQEYLTRFMRIDYDLEKHGVFAYPEP